MPPRPTDAQPDLAAIVAAQADRIAEIERTVDDLVAHTHGLATIVRPRQGMYTIAEATALLASTG